MKFHQPLRFRSHATALFVAAAFAGPAQATLATYAEYHLGEAGSLVGPDNLPQDSSGNGRHFTGNANGSLADVSSSAVTAPGSAQYIDTHANGAVTQGWYSDNLFGDLATDNFAFGAYVSCPSTAPNTDLFTLGGGNNVFKLSRSGGKWSASSHGVAWIGPAGGVAGSWKENEWVHLAVVRQGGISTFYINGAPQTGTYNGAPIHNTPHLNITPSGPSLRGRIDEARVVTFDASDTVEDILAALGGPPLDIRYVVRDGMNSYPKIALGGDLASEIRPGLDITEILDEGGFSVAGPHGLNIVPTAGLETGVPYDLFIYSGATDPDLDAFTLNLPEGVEANLSIDTVTLAPKKSVVLTFTDFGQIRWNGTAAAGGSDWNTTAVNWQSVAGGTAIPFANGDRLLFNNAAAVKTVNVTQDVSPSMMTFGADGDYLITGTNAVSVSGSLYLQGTGAVTLTAPVTVAGEVNLLNGTLRIGEGGTTGSLEASTLEISNGSLIFNRTDEVAFTPAITGTGLGSINQSGTGTTMLGPVTGVLSLGVEAGTLRVSPAYTASQTTIAAGSVLELNAGSLTELGGSVLTGGGTLRKTGTGTILWSAASANFSLGSGALIDVQEGTFTAGSFDNEIWTSNLADLNVATGATFDTVEATVLVDSLTGGGTIRSGYPGFATAAVICGVDNGGGTFNGAIINYNAEGAVGRLTKRGTGTQVIDGPVAVSGDTVVEDGILELGMNGMITLRPGANGMSNRIAGTGTLVLNGVLAIDRTAANLASGNSWNLIDTAGLNESYGASFFVANFVENGSDWILEEGDTTWTFSEVTGNLTLAMAAGSYGNWAGANAGGQGPDQDFDGDGVDNGIEFFMGESGSGFTVLPGPVSAGGTASVTWTRDPATTASFAVETSTILDGDWTPISSPDQGTVDTSDPSKVIYTFPTPPSGKRFVRLAVTP